MVQLKWYDAHGFGLAERNSRRDNLLTKGNEWVEKVHCWIDGRTSAQLAKAYGWGTAADVPPRLLVMARHAATFTGETRYDPRASWISWHALSEGMHEADGGGLLDVIDAGWRRASDDERSGRSTIIELPGMTVEVRIQGQG